MKAVSVKKVFNPVFSCLIEQAIVKDQGEKKKNEMEVYWHLPSAWELSTEGPIGITIKQTELKNS